MTTPLGFVTFSSTNPPIGPVLARLGDGVAQIDGDTGGWVDVLLPLREAAIEWQGTSPYREAIPIVLDGFTGRRSVQGDIVALRLMGRRPEGGSHPPIITIDGAVAGADLDWVIDGIDLDTTTEGVIRRSSDGAVVRQRAIVRLVRAKFDTVLVPTVVNAPTKAPKGSMRITGKHGDTLSKLAQKYYGDHRLWRKIGNVQKPKPIRDPRKDLANVKLVIPPK